MVDGPLAGGDGPLLVGQAVGDAIHDLVVMDQDQGTADDARIGHSFFVKGVEFVERFLQLLGRGRSGGGEGGR